MITRPITRPVASPIARAVTAAYGAWNPRALFALGEQGVIYDPNDLSTLFQDSAGTTPVTAAGQPVGLMLDKSGRGNHAFQPTAASRPILRQNATTGAYYLETDGVDDWMSTSAIDFTGTDKVSVFAGVRKLSDAVFGLIASQASWYIGNKTSGQYEVSRTGGVITAYFSTAAFSAPNSSVVAFSIDYAAGNEIPMLRVSGVPQAVTAGDSGSGNIGLGPLYIGRLNGTGLPFTGHFYGLTIVGRLTTDTETRSMERLLAQRTGVTLA